MPHTPIAATPEMVAAYARGDSIAAIAAAVGRHYGTVSKQLVNAGVEMRQQPYKRLPAPQRRRKQQDVVAAYARGDSIRQISAATGYSYGCIHRILTDTGVQLRRRGGPRRDNNGQPVVQASQEARP